MLVLDGLAAPCLRPVVITDCWMAILLLCDFHLGDDQEAGRGVVLQLLNLLTPDGVVVLLVVLHLLLH